MASVLSHGLRPSKAAWPPLLWRFSPGVTLGQLRVCETRGVDCRCLDVQSSERGQTFGKVGPRASATRTAAKRSKPAETFALGWPVSSSGPCSYLWQHSRDSWQCWDGVYNYDRLGLPKSTEQEDPGERAREEGLCGRRGRAFHKVAMTLNPVPWDRYSSRSHSQ